VSTASSRAETERQPLRGLTNREARERLRDEGPNELPPPPPRPLWRRLLRQLKSALIYVLLAALAVDFALWLYEGAVGLPLESLAIAAILVLNAGLGVWQEYRAEDALAKLRELEAPLAQVLRDGRLGLVASRELVRGDVVRLAAGGRVPADGQMEGEGTLVVRGAGYNEVSRTGPRSTMGRIAGMLGEVQSDPTPLERRLEVFGNRIAGWIVALAAVLVVGGVWAEGMDSLDEAFIWAVALAVAAIPEGLPAVLTLTLALGVERMSRRRAVVRKLASVEALGSVTVIATDKTGTLTENRMLVRELRTDDPERALRAIVLASNEAAWHARLRCRLEVHACHGRRRRRARELPERRARGAAGAVLDVGVRPRGMGEPRRSRGGAGPARAGAGLGPGRVRGGSPLAGSGALLGPAARGGAGRGARGPRGRRPRGDGDR
jgi:Ca2+-transporting ATPase